MTLPVLLMIATAALVNLPLGVWRARCPQFSWRWFVAIHASVPVLILLRIALDVDWTVIPFTAGAAIFGQLAGTRIDRMLKAEN